MIDILFCKEKVRETLQKLDQNTGVEHITELAAQLFGNSDGNEKELFGIELKNELINLAMDPKSSEKINLLMNFILESMNSSISCLTRSSRFDLYIYCD
jgi:hypothetical protein